MVDEVAARDVARGEITEHLRAWSSGDDRAAAAVFTALYDRLRELAGRALFAERTHHTLGNAGLVSEVFFRMMEQRIEWRSREQFIAIAGQMMRRILIDHARAHAAAKRGSGVATVPLTEAEQVPGEALDALVAIHDALEALAGVDREQSQIIELRFFCGLTHDEIASHLGLSLATVERRWRLARAWLYRYLEGDRVEP